MAKLRAATHLQVGDKLIPAIATSESVIAYVEPLVAAAAHTSGALRNIGIYAFVYSRHVARSYHGPSSRSSRFSADSLSTPFFRQLQANGLDHRHDSFVSDTP